LITALQNPKIEEDAEHKQDEEKKKVAQPGEDFKKHVNEYVEPVRYFTQVRQMYQGIIDNRGMNGQRFVHDAFELYHKKDDAQPCDATLLFSLLRCYKIFLKQHKDGYVGTAFAKNASLSLFAKRFLGAYAQACFIESSHRLDVAYTLVRLNWHETIATLEPGCSAQKFFKKLPDLNKKAYKIAEKYEKFSFKRMLYNAESIAKVIVGQLRTYKKMAGLFGRQKEGDVSYDKVNLADIGDYGRTPELWKEYVSRTYFW
jgi:hypothetical protein